MGRGTGVTLIALGALGFLWLRSRASAAPRSGDGSSADDLGEGVPGVENTLPDEGTSDSDLGEDFDWRGPEAGTAAVLDLATRFNSQGILDVVARQSSSRLRSTTRETEEDGRGISTDVRTDCPENTVAILRGVHAGKCAPICPPGQRLTADVSGCEPATFTRVGLA